MNVFESMYEFDRFFTHEGGIAMPEDFEGFEYCISTTLIHLLLD